MRRTTLFFLIMMLVVMTATSAVAASTELQEVHFFEQRGCPDCGRAKEFLEEIRSEHPDVSITAYSIMSTEYQQLFHEMMATRGVEDYNLIVPTLFIGENYFQNFFEEDKELIRRALRGENVQTSIDAVRGGRLLSLPFIGEVDMERWSIPFLAVIIGSVDGLNVCSIGALILILSLVLSSFSSRKKIFLFGGVFILTTTLMYGLLIFAWTALFNALARHISWLNILIGLAALGGGAFFFKKFIDFYRYGPACEYNDNSYLRRVTKKLQRLFSENQRTTLLLAGIILFAFVVTIVELPCSFGLPMIYAGILVAEGLTTTSYVFYVALYLFFYMLIELVIFTGAVITKEAFFTDAKWITWVYLFGSLVLIGLAYYYLIGF